MPATDQPLKKTRARRKSSSDVRRGKKRKRSGNDSRGPSKRRRSDKANGDDGLVDDDFIDNDDHVVDSRSEVEIEDESDQHSDSNSCSGEIDGEEGQDHDGGEVTIASLQTTIQQAKNDIKRGKASLDELGRLREEATGSISSLTRKKSSLQREKNAFCSRKRSEVRSIPM